MTVCEYVSMHVSHASVFVYVLTCVCVYVRTCIAAFKYVFLCV